MHLGFARKYNPVLDIEGMSRKRWVCGFTSVREGVGDRVEEDS